LGAQLKVEVLWGSVQFCRAPIHFNHCS